MSSHAPADRPAFHPRPIRAAPAPDPAGAEPTGRGQAFWRDALALHGSVSPYVLPHVVAAGVVATLVCLGAAAARQWLGLDLRMEVGPHEIAGAVLGLLLVLRTNAGYDRWWEARKLWGGIVNQSRNLAVGALAYGPDDPAWRDRVARWAAAFPHLIRASLRGEGPPPEAAALVGTPAAARLAAADHMPSAAAYVLARLLRAGEGRMSPFAFVQVDRERALLIDHLGGCERILKTPLPRVYAIKIRRFIVLYLLMLPLALLHEVDSTWLVPLITMMVAYPLFSLDQIGVELQNPFSTRNLSHLPLDQIAAGIARNVTALADAEALADVVWPADRPAPPRPRVTLGRARDGRSAGGRDTGAMTPGPCTPAAYTISAAR